MSIEELKEIQKRVINKTNKTNTTAKIIYLLIFIFTVSILLITRIPIYAVLILTIFIMGFALIITLIVTSVIQTNKTSPDIELFYKNFKKIFVLETLKKNFDNLVYTPEKGFDKEYIDNIGMVNTADSFYSNDYISGKYKNIGFEQSDLEIQEEYEVEDKDGKTHTEYRTIFKGRLMIFDFYKNFKSNIQICSGNFGAESLPWNKKFTRVTLDDEEFNEKFVVFSQDEHVSFCLLTPAYMAKIKEVSNKINSPLMLCFIDNKLHIALDNNTDAFEHNIYKEINEQEIESNIMKDIKVITDFVDELNLDKEVFK